MPKAFSRRDFLTTSSIFLAASSLTACRQLVPTTPTPTSGPDSPTVEIPTSTPTTAAALIMESLLDDTPQVFMNTYFGSVGASPPSPQNPQGIHQGMDFVAPAGTPIKATSPGVISKIMKETKTESDGTQNTYANLIVTFDERNAIVYVFEPFKDLFVVEGQTIETGDVLGTLADNRGQNIRGTGGTGTLDLGLLSLVGDSFQRICYVPFVSPTFRSLMETWFARAYKATAEHPGPCVCHYHYP
jgi:hypothetical protein